MILNSGGRLHASGAGTGRQSSIAPSSMIPVSFEESFLMHAKRTPEKDAYVYRDASGNRTTLTYDDVLLRTNGIAKELAKYAFKPDDIIAIQQEAPLQRILDTIACFRAGVPCIFSRADTIEEIRLNVPVKLILSKTKNASRNVPSLDTSRVVSDGENPTFRHVPSTMKYVSQSSGSTGAKKNAANIQEGVDLHRQAKVDLVGLNSESRMLVLAQPEFNVYYYNITGPTSQGGTVYTYPHNLLKDNPTAFMQMAYEDRITHTQLTPTQWKEYFLPVLKEDHTLGHFFQNINYTGEGITYGTLYQGQSLLPHVSFPNTAGCNECSDDTTEYMPPPLPPLSEQQPLEDFIPVGHPIPGSGVLILDSLKSDVIKLDATFKQPALAPPNKPGLFWITGRGVGTGYFVKHVLRPHGLNPFNPEERLFPLNESASYNTKGEITFLGRADAEGGSRPYEFRFSNKLPTDPIQLGKLCRQVEQAILTQSTAAGLPMTNVVVREYRRDRDYSLAAYYTGKKPICITRVRGFESEILQSWQTLALSHQIPHAFIHMGNSFPMTDSGKQTLPYPDIDNISRVSSPITTYRGDENEPPFFREAFAFVLGLDVSKLDLNECFFNLFGTLDRADHLKRICAIKGYDLNLEKFNLGSSIENWHVYLSRIYPPTQTSNSALPL
ncbi:AMP-binding protein [bacterium]|jgi:acyl-CoA synthetase (AMP-forming)/AMP-acid ligase II|nr:AMP-binding protein [bacterium]